MKCKHDRPVKIIDNGTMCFDCACWLRKDVPYINKDKIFNSSIPYFVIIGMLTAAVVDLILKLGNTGDISLAERIAMSIVWGIFGGGVLSYLGYVICKHNLIKYEIKNAKYIKDPNR